MIDTDARAATDEAIARSLARVKSRATAIGGEMAALGSAIERAADGGKRFRPALVVASFRAFGGGDAGALGVYDVAAAFELLHTAFVAHDDVIDHDTVRRGIPNIGGEFRERALDTGADGAGATLLGDAAGILAGDLLLHEAQRIIALSPAAEPVRRALLDQFDDAVYVSAGGELADVGNAVAADVADSASIFAAAYNKTAVYSFSAPLRAGALLAGAPPSAVERLGSAGGRIGLAFQLVDDLIGAFGTAAAAGKDEGVDLREAKRTPLIAYARESADWARVDAAVALAHTGPVAVRQAQRLLERSGAPQRLRSVIDDTLADALRQAGDPALPTAAEHLLGDLAEQVKERIP
ncbi:polyprenyl synthetase family protein [Microbacterium aquimaris]|uniref:Polyprenyl synthetase family protein n=1 Tax=Microbacterium aquimaris TaxID=459816 RepID=A0ABU5N7D5_9MICO|nr:polyprenyl synthetase family protein [Microbacterium aquimaris]MDZ8161957.1 polyprenyl synthetase family protein [Microbacterium aquimaris]